MAPADSPKASSRKSFVPPVLAASKFKNAPKVFSPRAAAARKNRQQKLLSEKADSPKSHTRRSASPSSPRRQEDSRSPRRKPSLTRTFGGLDVSRSGAFEPRPVRVALVTWRACCTLTSMVVYKSQSARQRIKRLRSEFLISKLLRQVLRWEQYAECLPWTPPSTEELDTGEIVPVAGQWLLFSGLMINVNDAVAAMIYASKSGGIRGDFARFVQVYCEGFKKRLPLKGYTEHDYEKKEMHRKHLQKEFKSIGYLNRRYQLETKILANELGKYRGDNKQLEFIMNNAGPKDKYFKVTLQHSHLTSDACLAARALFVFRQLGKLYHSVHYLAQHGPALVSHLRKQQIIQRKTGGQRYQVQKKYKKKRNFNEIFGDELAEAAEEDDAEEDEDEEDVELKVAKKKMKRASVSSGDPLSRSRVSLAEDLAHKKKMDDLEDKCLQLKLAALETGGGRFDQLISLVDQGQIKLTKLVKEAKRARDNIRNLYDSLEGEIAPYSEQWMQDAARRGEISQDILEKVEEQNASKFGKNERDVQKRKLAKLQKMLNDRTKETGHESSLILELEALSGIDREEWIIQAGVKIPLPPRTKSLMDVLAQGTEYIAQHIHTWEDLVIPDSKPGTPDGDDASNSPAAKPPPPGPPRESTILKSLPARARAAKALDRIKENVSKVQVMHQETTKALPRGASYEGDDLIINFGIFFEESQSVEEKATAVVNPEHVAKFESEMLEWSLDCHKIVQNLELVSDTLNIDKIPDVLKEIAIQEKKEEELLNRGANKAEKANPSNDSKPNTKPNDLDMLRSKKEAFKKELLFQESRNAKQRMRNADLTKQCEQIEKDLYSACGETPPPSTTKTSPKGRKTISKNVAISHGGHGKHEGFSAGERDRGATGNNLHRTAQDPRDTAIANNPNRMPQVLNNGAASGNLNSMSQGFHSGAANANPQDSRNAATNAVQMQDPNGVMRQVTVEEAQDRLRSLEAQRDNANFKDKTQEAAILQEIASLKGQITTVERLRSLEAQRDDGSVKGKAQEAAILAEIASLQGQLKTAALQPQDSELDEIFEEFEDKSTVRATSGDAMDQAAQSEISPPSPKIALLKQKTAKQLQFTKQLTEEVRSKHKERDNLIARIAELEAQLVNIGVDHENLGKNVEIVSSPTNHVGGRKKGSKGPESVRLSVCAANAQQFVKSMAKEKAKKIKEMENNASIKEVDDENEIDRKDAKSGSRHKQGGFGRRSSGAFSRSNERRRTFGSSNSDEDGVSNRSRTGGPSGGGSRRRRSSQEQDEDDYEDGSEPIAQRRRGSASGQGTKSVNGLMISGFAGRSARSVTSKIDTGQADREREIQEQRKAIEEAKQAKEDVYVEPWLRAFPNDPPDVAKAKYEFCRVHKIEYVHLSIPKRQRRLKFKLMRMVKQERRTMKLKTKLLLTFLTDDQKAAFEMEVSSPDAEVKRAAHHKAELSRLTDRSNMLGKLLDFWQRRMGAFEKDLQQKRTKFRNEVLRVLGQVERVAQLLSQDEFHRGLRDKLFQAQQAAFSEALELERNRLSMNLKTSEENSNVSGDADSRTETKESEDQRGSGIQFAGATGLDIDLAISGKRKTGIGIHHFHAPLGSHSADHEGQKSMDGSRKSFSFRIFSKSVFGEKEQHFRDEPNYSGPGHDIRMFGSELIKGEKMGIGIGANGGEPHRFSRSLQKNSTMSLDASSIGLQVSSASSIRPRTDDGRPTDWKKWEPINQIELPNLSVDGLRTVEVEKKLNQAIGRLKGDGYKKVEVEALMFLHTVFSNLGKIGADAESGLPPEDVALSDTLLSDKTQVLFKEYLEHFLYAPAPQRNIALNHLIGIERARLLLLVKHSGKKAVRNAISAVQLSIKALETLLQERAGVAAVQTRREARNIVRAMLGEDAGSSDESEQEQAWNSESEERRIGSRNVAVASEAATGRKEDGALLIGGENMGFRKQKSQERKLITGRVFTQEFEDEDSGTLQIVTRKLGKGRKTLSKLGSAHLADGTTAATGELLEMSGKGNSDPTSVVARHLPTSAAAEAASEFSATLSITNTLSLSDGLKVAKLSFEDKARKSMHSDRHSPSTSDSEDTSDDEEEIEAERVMREKYRYAKPRAAGHLGSIMGRSWVMPKLRKKRTADRLSTEEGDEVEKKPSVVGVFKRKAIVLGRMALIKSRQSDLKSMMTIMNENRQKYEHAKHRFAKLHFKLRRFMDPEALARTNAAYGEDGLLLRPSSAQHGRLEQVKKTLEDVMLETASDKAKRRFARRKTLLPLGFAEELEAEWKAIKEAVRESKNTFFNAQQRRVAEMLQEMGDSSQAGEGVQASLHTERKAKIPSGVCGNVRKEIVRAMRHEIRRRARDSVTLYGDDGVGRKAGRKLRRKNSNSSDDGSTTKWSSWKLDQVLFGEGSGSEQNSDEDLDLARRPALKRKYTVKGDLLIERPEDLLTPPPPTHGVLSVVERDLRPRVPLLPLRLGETQYGEKYLAHQGEHNTRVARSHRRASYGQPRPQKIIRRKRSSRRRRTADMAKLVNEMGMPSELAEARKAKRSKKRNRATVRKLRAAEHDTDFERKFEKIPSNIFARSTSVEDDDVQTRKSKPKRRTSPPPKVSGPSMSSSGEEGEADDIGTDDSGHESQDADGEMTDSDGSSISGVFSVNVIDTDKPAASRRASADKPAASRRASADDGASGSSESSEWADSPDIPRGRRNGVILSAELLADIEKAQELVRPKLDNDGSTLEEMMRLPLFVIIHTALEQDPSLLEILGNTTLDKLVEAIEGMLLALEEAYVGIDSQNQSFYRNIDIDRPIKSKKTVPKRRHHPWLEQEEPRMKARTKLQISMERGWLATGRVLMAPLQLHSKPMPQKDIRKVQSDKGNAKERRHRNQKKKRSRPPAADDETHEETNDEQNDERNDIMWENLLGDIGKQDNSNKIAPVLGQPEQENTAEVAPVRGTFVPRCALRGQTKQEQHGGQDTKKIELFRGALHEAVETAFRDHVTLWNSWRHDKSKVATKASVKQEAHALESESSTYRPEEVPEVQPALTRSSTFLHEEFEEVPEAQQTNGEQQQNIADTENANLLVEMDASSSSTSSVKNSEQCSDLIANEAYLKPGQLPPLEVDITSKLLQNAVDTDLQAPTRPVRHGMVPPIKGHSTNISETSKAEPSLGEMPPFVCRGVARRSNVIEKYLASFDHEELGGLLSLSRAATDTSGSRPGTGPTGEMNRLNLNSTTPSDLPASWAKIGTGITPPIPLFGTPTPRRTPGAISARGTPASRGEQRNGLLPKLSGSVADGTSPRDAMHLTTATTPSFPATSATSATSAGTVGMTPVSTSDSWKKAFTGRGQTPTWMQLGIKDLDASTRHEDIFPAAPVVRAATAHGSPTSGRGPAKLPQLPERSAATVGGGEVDHPQVPLSARGGLAALCSNLEKQVVQSRQEVAETLSAPVTARGRNGPWSVATGLGEKRPVPTRARLRAA